MNFIPRLPRASGIFQGPFQVAVFKRRRHAVDLALRYTLPGRFVAPLRDNFADLFDYFTRPFSEETYVAIISRSAGVKE